MTHAAITFRFTALQSPYAAQQKAFIRGWHHSCTAVLCQLLNVTSFCTACHMFASLLQGILIKLVCLLLGSSTSSSYEIISRCTLGHLERHPYKDWACRSFWIWQPSNNIMRFFSPLKSHAAAELVEALCYEEEGRGFESRWGYCIFPLT
jgi:hypothetical protein